MLFGAIRAECFACCARMHVCVSARGCEKCWKAAVIGMHFPRKKWSFFTFPVPVNVWWAAWSVFHSAMHACVRGCVRVWMEISSQPWARSECNRKPIFLQVKPSERWSGPVGVTFGGGKNKAAVFVQSVLLPAATVCVQRDGKSEKFAIMLLLKWSKQKNVIIRSVNPAIEIEAKRYLSNVPLASFPVGVKKNCWKNPVYETC